MRIRRAPGFPSARLLDLLIRWPVSLIGSSRCGRPTAGHTVRTNHQPGFFVCPVQDVDWVRLFLAVCDRGLRGGGDDLGREGTS